MKKRVPTRVVSDVKAREVALGAAIVPIGATYSSRELAGLHVSLSDGSGSDVIDHISEFKRLETLRLVREGLTFEEIAKARGRQIQTVVNAVANLVERGALEFNPEWVDRNKLAVIEAACAQHGVERLKVLKDAVPPEVTYDEIRLVVARLRREQKQNSAAIPA